MALSLSLEDILVRAPTEAAAFAGGLAIHPALAPLLRDLENITWHAHPDKRLDLMLAAAVAAEDVAQYDAMQNEAQQGGYDSDRFKWAHGATLSAPGIGELLTLLRRTNEVSIDFEHGLRKAKLETRWDEALRNLRDVRIPGPDLAYMVVRGVVPDGGTLPSALPTGADRLTLPPQLRLDTLAEAAFTGWDRERFAALVARSGLAMAPGLAAQAYFRGILTDNDYLLTIARGDLFPAYADPVREVSRQILTAGEYQEAALRGVLTRAEADAKAAQHGMTAEDADLLFQIMGRPLNVHQITTGLARGATIGGTYADVPEPYRDAIRRSNIRPEYARLAYANRYSYPSAFVLRSLAQAGELGDAQAVEKILLEIGWPPLLAAKVAPSWVGGGTSADTHVSKAQTQLWTATHKAYVNDRIDATAATTALSSAGVAAASVSDVLRIWDAERELVRAGLSAAQIKKAFHEAVLTVDEAVARLVELGWSTADAQTYLPL